MATNAFDDYGVDIEAPSHEAFNKLNDLVIRYTDAAARVARLEDELRTASETLSLLVNKEIPELMDQLQLESFRSHGGMEVAVKEDIRASISKANQSAAFRWLEENGNGDLIKNEIMINLGRGQNDEAQDIVDAVKSAARPGTAIAQKQAVHGQTLAKFVRDALACGQGIPLELFGVFRQRVAKITAPK